MQDASLGTTSQLPSSNTLFRKWFRDSFGIYPDYNTVPTWAALDVIESALYRAASNPSNIVNGEIPASKVMLSLMDSEVRTPFGRVSFDNKGVNDAATALFSQCLPSSNTSEIVYPSYVLTAKFVYPMPTWEERVYSWGWVKGSEKVTAFIVAAVCTGILFAISVTVVVYRKGNVPHPPVPPILVTLLRMQ